MDPSEKKAPADWPRRRHRDQRGTSTLELLVVWPLLLLVLFAIVELSRAWLNLNIVTTAAREGARVGSVTPTLPNGGFNATPAITRINQVLNAAHLTASSVSVTCPSPCLPDSEVSAEVRVTFETAVPLVLPMLQPLTIEQTAIMRYE